MRPTIGVLVLAVCLAGWSGAQDRGTGEKSNVIAEFRVANDGDFLLLPVTIGGKEFCFLLDTGADLNVFDSSLVAKKAEEEIAVQTATETTSAKVCRAPAAKLGPIDLDPDAAVISADLRSVREMTGHPVYGVLGMAFLGKHIVQIDFDRGLVALLRSVPAGAGTPFKLSTLGKQVPAVSIDLSGCAAEQFVLDTGSLMQASGGIRAALYDQLCEKAVIKPIGSSNSGSLWGRAVIKFGRATGTSLGSFAIEQPILHSQQDNIMGLTFLSRFRITFDFPNKTVYLAKGKRYDNTDAYDVSGLHLLRVGEKTIVHSVDPGSPAAEAGVVAGDVVTKVADTDVSQFRLLQLRRMLCAPGREIKMVISRDDREHGTTLSLKDWR